MEHTQQPTIRDLYPELSETALREAEENMNQYLALVLRIFERQESERYSQADP